MKGINVPARKARPGHGSLNCPWNPNAAGYGFILIVVAFFRELLGSGKLLGYQVIQDIIYEMGYVNNGHAKINNKVFLEVRGKKVPANICDLPFYKKNYVKGEANV